MEYILYLIQEIGNMKKVARYVLPTGVFVGECDCCNSCPAFEGKIKQFYLNGRELEIIEYAGCLDAFNKNKEIFIKDDVMLKNNPIRIILENKFYHKIEIPDWCPFLHIEDDKNEE